MWTAGTGDPMHGVRFQHRIPRAREHSGGEARGRNRHENNRKRGVRNIEERNLGTNKKSQTRPN